MFCFFVRSWDTNGLKTTKTQCMWCPINILEVWSSSLWYKVNKDYFLVPLLTHRMVKQGCDWLINRGNDVQQTTQDKTKPFTTRVYLTPCCFPHTLIPVDIYRHSIPGCACLSSFITYMTSRLCHISCHIGLINVLPKPSVNLHWPPSRYQETGTETQTINPTSYDSHFPRTTALWSFGGR